MEVFWWTFLFFFNAELSVVRLSVRQYWGGGVYLRNTSVTFLLFLAWSFFASLGWHKLHIERDIWLNRSKVHFSRSETSNLALFAFGGHLLQNCSVTFSLVLHRASQEGYQWTSERVFAWITLKVFFKVGKVRFGPFSHMYMCYSVVPKCCPI